MRNKQIRYIQRPLLLVNHMASSLLLVYGVSLPHFPETLTSRPIFYEENNPLAVTRAPFHEETLILCLSGTHSSGAVALISISLNGM